MIQNFEELRIYQQARELSKEVYALTRKGEWKYDSRFLQQIRAAAGSVMNNIAEGFECQGNKEFKQFLYVAKWSAGEVRSQLNRASDVGFIDNETYARLYNDCKVLSAGILHFIQSMNQSSYKGSKFDNISRENSSQETETGIPF
jgi:four helix bundle protein